MLTVTGAKRRPIAVPPGPVADPLSDRVAAPGAIASKSTAASSPTPDAPVESAARVSVMSMRFPLTDCAKTTLMPPARMKLPSCTVRTRSFVGSKITVSVIVEIRCASVIEIGTVYGPPPTRRVGPGGVISTCAEPTPADVVGTAGAVCAGGLAGGVAGGVGSGGTTTGGGWTAGGVAAGAGCG